MSVEESISEPSFSEASLPAGPFPVVSDLEEDADSGFSADDVSDFPEDAFSFPGSVVFSVLPEGSTSDSAVDALSLS